MTAFLGMLAASVDAAGRSFPLALFREIATAEARETLPLLPTVLAGFVSDATTLLSSGPNFDGQTIARQAEALAVELPALPAPYAWKNEPASGLEAALEGSLPAVALRAAHAGRRVRPGSRRRDHRRERAHGRRTGGGTRDERPLARNCPRPSRAGHHPFPPLDRRPAAHHARASLAPGARLLANPRHRSSRFWPLRTAVTSAVDQAWAALTPEQRATVEDPNATFGDLAAAFG